MTNLGAELKGKMRELCTTFFQRLPSASRRVLLLDYDGTLAPFHTDRSQAQPYAGIPGLLSQIANCGTRIVLISGRPARELAGLAGFHPQPEIWGSHGFERLSPEGGYTATTITATQQSGLELGRDCLSDNGVTERLELKPGGIALHWRGMDRPGIEKMKKDVLKQWMPLLLQHRLKLLEFDGGIELRIPGATKGDAVRTILAESGEGAAVAYLGDDQTDEDAFHALKGKGLTVLVAVEPRPTQADICLRPPHDVVDFLEHWLGQCAAVESSRK